MALRVCGTQLTAFVPLKCPAHHTETDTRSSALTHTLNPIVLPLADPLDSNPDVSLAKVRLCFKSLPFIGEERGGEECNQQKCI